MTQTPNIGLKKIDGNENWRNVFDYHNDSMDLADEAIAGVRAGLTYVENGDTIAANAAYTEGKFICWKGEIYRIRTTINTTVTSSNWTTYLAKMDGIGGALSQINGDLTALNSKLPTQQTYSADIGLDMDEVKDLGALTELVPSNGKSYGAITCYSSSNGNCLVMMKSISGSLHLIAKNLASFHINTTAYMRVLLI